MDSISQENKAEFGFQWHITDRCNLRCTHCYQEDYSGSNELDLDGLKNIANEIIKTLAKWGKKGDIAITGGEPLVKEEAKKLLGKPLESRDLVFSHPDGRPIRPDSVTRAFHKIAESVRLRGVRLHDLRHAHATILLQQGVNPKIVQERLGHSSVSTTLDIYSHVLPGLQEAAARQFDEGFEHEVHQRNVGKMSAKLS